MGAAGDMILSALYELIGDKKKFIDDLNAAGLPGIVYEACHVSCQLHMYLRREGLDLRLNTQVERYEDAGDGMRVHLKGGKQGVSDILDADIVLMTAFLSYSAASRSTNVIAFTGHSGRQSPRPSQ